MTGLLPCRIFRRAGGVALRTFIRQVRSREGEVAYDFRKLRFDEPKPPVKIEKGGNEEYCEYVEYKIGPSSDAQNSRDSHRQVRSQDEQRAEKPDYRGSQ